MKFLRVVGARPMFMQVPILRQALIKRGHQEILLHTGQHYDDNMSRIFFEQLGLPRADINLNIGSSSHGAQTGQMLAALDEILLSTKPDVMVVDGDTNSTLAGALAAAKLHIPLVHVESGLRSFDRKMPEEINRIVTDHVADILCAPTATAIQNLICEGLGDKAALTGDVLYDSFLYYRQRANDEILKKYHLKNQPFILSTVHRAENTDDETRLTAILQALNAVDKPVVLPLHPRTQNILAKQHGNDFVNQFSNIHFIEPVGYLEMITLETHAACIMTDSGGVQREAFFAEVPSVILRDSTEWVEQIDYGWSVLGGVTKEEILAAYRKLLTLGRTTVSIYGNGDAAEKVVAAIEKKLI